MVVPYPVAAPRPSSLSRDDFGLPRDVFVSLAVFNSASSIARKNPLGAIAAHRAAFGDSPDHLLILKTQKTQNAGPAWAAVAEAAAAAANVKILDQDMPEGDLAALMVASDVLVSLHRSEGFGFVVAEGLSLGKPVVATNWSGNVDFMTGPGAFRVPCELVPARDPQETYNFPDMYWADPDIEEAAAYLRQIAGDRSLRNPPPVHFAHPNYADLLR